MSAVIDWTIQNADDGPGVLTPQDDGKFLMWDGNKRTFSVATIRTPRVMMAGGGGGQSGGGGTSTIAGADDFIGTTGPGTDGYAIIWNDTAGAFTLGAFEAVGVAAGLLADHVAEVNPHTQYLLAADYDPITDHGALSGLGDDDHPQYLLATSYTAADVLSKLLTVDGSGSGLDADLLDGNSSAAFELAGTSATHAALTAAHGATGAVVGTTNTQTLTNKTLTTPTIGSFANATHSHQDAAGGGQLDHGLALTGLGDDDHTIYLLATGARTGASSQAQTFTNGIIGPTWQPASNSTTALRLTNAGGTAVITVDTINNRVGINRTPTTEFDVYQAAASSIHTIATGSTTANHFAGFQLVSDTVTATARAYTAASSGGARLNLTAAGGYILFGTTTADTVQIYANNAARMVVGTTGLISMGHSASGTAFVDAAASTTTSASLRLRHGSAPSSPNDGDAWTTTGGFFVRVNGVTQTYLTSTGTVTGASSQAQTFTNGIIGPSWKPASDSTTAIQIQTSAGVSMMTVDTTNTNVIVNPTGITSRGLIIGNVPTMPALTMFYIAGGFPTIAQEVRRGNGGFAASAFALSATNTTSSLTTALIDIGVLGGMQTSPTPPSLTYLYLSSLPSPAFNNANLFLLPSGYIGVGTGNTAPSAWLDIKAATTAEASLRIRSGARPTTPNAGDIWFDGALVSYTASATTSAIVNSLKLERGTSGSAAGGLGIGIVAQLESSTTDANDIGRLTWEWDRDNAASATHATRSGRARLTAFYTSTERVIIDGIADSSAAKVGFLGATPVARASAYTQTFSTAARTMNAYTADDESAAYTGQDNAQVGSVYAKLTDLNFLRVAVENLRAAFENRQQVINALIDDSQAFGLAA